MDHSVSPTISARPRSDRVEVDARDTTRAAHVGHHAEARGPNGAAPDAQRAVGRAFDERRRPPDQRGAQIRARQQAGPRELVPARELVLERAQDPGFGNLVGRDVPEPHLAAERQRERPRERQPREAEGENDPCHTPKRKGPVSGLVNVARPGGPARFGAADSTRFDGRPLWYARVPPVSFIAIFSTLLATTLVTAAPRRAPRTRPIPKPKVAAPKSAAAEADEKPVGRGPVIAKILVRGNRKIEADAIKVKIGSKEGEHFSDEQVARDIRDIFSLASSATCRSTAPKAVVHRF